MKIVGISCCLILLSFFGRGVIAMEHIQSPYGPLSVEEKQVILNHGTERAFTGCYTDTFECGVYACRNCGAPLYRSDDKFHSGCGWPAFDDEIPGAVRRLSDPGDSRTEILCAGCGAHLGHVFSGEQFTAKDIRNCVNSLSLRFEPQQGGRLGRAVFAGGCFWGVEAMLARLPGVAAVTSGYTGGKVANPSYRQVCSGKTGHVEAVEVVFDRKQTDFETLCRCFLEIHDPTQEDRQGPDIGPQYRSVIFYLDQEQEKTAARLLELLRRKGYRIVTRVEKFERFWNAEPGHQDYYRRNGQTPYCHIYTRRF